jgi:hypothetical protein
VALWEQAEFVAFGIRHHREATGRGALHPGAAECLHTGSGGVHIIANQVGMDAILAGLWLGYPLKAQMIAPGKLKVSIYCIAHAFSGVRWMVPARALGILVRLVWHMQDGRTGVPCSSRAAGTYLRCHYYVTNTQMDLEDEHKL